MRFDAIRSCALSGLVTVATLGCDAESDPPPATQGSSGSPHAEGTTTTTTDTPTTSTTARDSGETSAGTSGGAAETGPEPTSGASATETSGTSSGDTSTGGAALSEGDVQVDVTYEGVSEGTLTTALFGACPPAGPPSSFSQIMPADLVFPQRVELLGTGLAAGATACVVSFLDVDPPSPTAPGPEDPAGQQVFDVAAGMATTVAVALEDPS